MSGGRLLSYREAAERIGCSVSTIRRRVRTGELPTFADGGLRRIREDDLGRYVVEHLRRRSSGEPAAAAASGRALPKGARLWD